MNAWLGGCFDVAVLAWTVLPHYKGVMIDAGSRMHCSTEAHHCGFALKAIAFSNGKLSHPCALTKYPILSIQQR